MKPSDRVVDSFLVELEVEREAMPWYSTMARLQTQQRNYVASSFTRAVAQCRSIKADPEIVWEELGNELSVWNHQNELEN